MRRVTVFLIFLAGAVAVLTALLVQKWVDQQRERVAAIVELGHVPQPTVEILAVRQNLPSGGQLKRADLAWLAWPESGMIPEYLRRGEVEIDALVGAVLRQSMVAGQPLLEGGYALPGDRSFLAAALSPGMRAVTIPVSATSGVGGFVIPGDKVDVILIHTPTRWRPQQRAGETVLTDVRVLAVGQRMESDAGGSEPARNVTLELSPRNVNRIALAQSMGQLLLSLRSLGIAENAEIPTQGLEAVPYVMESDTSVLVSKPLDMEQQGSDEGFLEGDTVMVDEVTGGSGDSRRRDAGVFVIRGH